MAPQLKTFEYSYPLHFPPRFLALRVVFEIIQDGDSMTWSREMDGVPAISIFFIGLTFFESGYRVILSFKILVKKSNLKGPSCLSWGEARVDCECGGRTWQGRGKVRNRIGM
jgi:hypothetical protein